MSMYFDAIAAADELHIFNLILLYIKVDHLRAGSFGFILIHMKNPFCFIE